MVIGDIDSLMFSAGASWIQVRPEPERFKGFKLQTITPPVPRPCYHTVICALIFTVLGLGWIYAGYIRSKNLWRVRRQTEAVGLDNIGPSHSLWTPQLPKLTILLPVAGCRPSTIATWRTLLVIPYPGSLEILVLVHSRSDPAYTAAQQQLLGLTGVRRAHNTMRVCTTGLAENCSQKVHNLVVGVRAASHDSKYVLCMDDDVRMHPRMLTDLVKSLENDPSSPYMATGFPMDVPSRCTAGLWTYTVLSFHLHLLIAFSLPRVRVVWGGLMLFRLQDLLDDTSGLMHAWASGGYSDDMICSAVMGQKGLRIVSPNTAVFLQEIDHDVSFARLWNYLCRQVFVLDTYHNCYNRIMNQSILVFTFVGSIAYVTVLLLLVVRSIFWAACWLLPSQPTYNLILLKSVQSVSGVPNSSPWDSWKWSSDRLVMSGHMLRQAIVDLSNEQHCKVIDIPALAVSMSLVLMFFASRWFSSVILCNVQLMAPEQVPRHKMNWVKMWLGMALQQVLMPCAIVRNLSRRTITWARIRYRIQNGKVTGIEHAVPTNH